MRSTRRCVVSVTELHPFTLGGSTIPAVLGLDPYLTPYALGARLLDPSLAPPMNDAMRTGLRLQTAHLWLLEDDGYTVMPAPEAGFTHPELPWLVGHPDGFVALNGERAPLELKLRGLAPSDATRQRDTVQALVYAAVVGAAGAVVSTLHGGYGGIQRDQWEVEHDPELFEMIVARCESFLDLLRRGKLPAPSGSASDRDAIRRRFEHAEPGKTIRLTQDGWTAVRRIRELDETISAAKAQREKWAQRVQVEMGDATEAISPHDTAAARWRASTRTTLDGDKVKRSIPGWETTHAKTTTTRRFEANP